MERNERSSWEKDFTEFVKTSDVAVPQTLADQVLGAISAEMNPSALMVFAKTAFFQFAVGLVTLLFCPQFGISFTSSHGIMPYLMKYGDEVCMLGCGAFFTAFSLLIVSFVLRPEEVRALKRHEVFQLASVATLSLGAFLCLGGEIVLMLGLVWVLGAVIGGAISLELGWMLRKKLMRKAVA